MTLSLLFPLVAAASMAAVPGDAHAAAEMGGEPCIQHLTDDSVLHFTASDGNNTGLQQLAELCVSHCGGNLVGAALPESLRLSVGQDPGSWLPETSLSKHASVFSRIDRPPRV